MGIINKNQRKNSLASAMSILLGSNVIKDGYRNSFHL